MSIRTCCILPFNPVMNFFSSPRRWIDLSPDAKDLLIRMLSYKEDKRLTAKQVGHLEVAHGFQPGGSFVHSKV